MRRALTITLCGFGLALAPSTGAAADGGPVPPVQGGAGVSAPGGEFNFIALGAGRNKTVIERVRRRSGVVERSRVIDGYLGVPGVTYGGAATGLSADGRTLVLAEFPRIYPQKETKLVVLDAVRMRRRAGGGGGGARGGREGGGVVGCPRYPPRGALPFPPPKKEAKLARLRGAGL